MKDDVRVHVILTRDQVTMMLGLLGPPKTALMQAVQDAVLDALAKYDRDCASAASIERSETERVAKRQALLEADEPVAEGTCEYAVWNRDGWGSHHPHGIKAKWRRTSGGRTRLLCEIHRKVAGA